MSVENSAGDGWAQVAALLEERVAAQMQSIAELEQSSGVSFKTWKRALAGEPIMRKDKRRQIAVAVGWTPDSIDRVLRGETPTLVGSSGDDLDLAARLKEFDTRLAELQAEVTELRQQRSAATSRPRKSARPTES